MMPAATDSLKWIIGKRDPVVGYRVSWSAVLVGVLVVLLSLVLTFFRHEALHVVGAWMTGGRWIGLTVFPGSGLVASVDLAWASGPAWSVLAISLALPYIADFTLMISATALARSQVLRPYLAQIIFQHALYFSALDLLLNCGGSLFGSNDWTLLLVGAQSLHWPIVIGVFLTTIAVVRWQTKRWKNVRCLSACTDGFAMASVAYDRNSCRKFGGQGI